MCTHPDAIFIFCDHTPGRKFRSSTHKDLRLDKGGGAGQSRGAKTLDIYPLISQNATASFQSLLVSVSFHGPPRGGAEPRRGALPKGGAFATISRFNQGSTLQPFPTQNTRPLADGDIAGARVWDGGAAARRAAYGGVCVGRGRWWGGGAPRCLRKCMRVGRGRWGRVWEGGAVAHRAAYGNKGTFINTGSFCLWWQS